VGLSASIGKEEGKIKRTLNVQSSGFRVLR
jgi:hypothetical protein